MHHENWQKRKCKVYRYITKIDLCYKLQLLIRICFFWASVIYKVFVADSEHVIICCKRSSAKTIVVLFLKYLAQQTNTYSKARGEICEKLTVEIALLY